MNRTTLASLGIPAALLLFGAAILARPASAQPAGAPPGAKEVRAAGVCPPYRLRDERGQVIDPVRGINDAVPYSPKQTCGASGCHDYGTITRGYHFTQGKGEALPEGHAQRYAWVTTPGQYGGRW